MTSYEIVIEYEDPDRFKEGMHDIRRQMWHIKSQIKLLKEHRDRLAKMEKDAINAYCDPDNELITSKIWIPKSIAKV